MNNCYKKYESPKINCARFIYIEHAIKKVGLSRAILLANCFINMYTIKCGYGDFLNKEVEKYCPEIFKKELKIPDFYLNTVKLKLKLNTI